MPRAESGGSLRLPTIQKAMIMSQKASWVPRETINGRGIWCTHEWRGSRWSYNEELVCNAPFRTAPCAPAVQPATVTPMEFFPPIRPCCNAGDTEKCGVMMVVTHSGYLGQNKSRSAEGEERKPGPMMGWLITPKLNELRESHPYEVLGGRDWRPRLSLFSSSSRGQHVPNAG